MYRSIEQELVNWSKKSKPLPIIVRGARQVGKSFSIRKFGLENFKNFIEINFETMPDFLDCFKSTNIDEICTSLEIKTLKKISIKNTLIFIDEIQESAIALRSLRSFYENKPGLHVIAAGSLLEFMLKKEEISIPVGRVHYLFMRPMSFYEFLLAKGAEIKLDYIKNISLKKPINPAIHNDLLKDLKEFLLCGGMPLVIYKYLEKGILEAFKIQKSLINTYKDDFGKYAKISHHHYLEQTFMKSSKYIGSKFKYSNIDREIKSRELKQALNLLVSAGVINKVVRSSGAGLPFEAEASDKDFKLIHLDVGLLQNILGMNEEIFSSKDFHSIAAGAITEQFAGQEILNARDFCTNDSLYYWERSGSSQSAEVDYLVNAGSEIIPVEVKSGKRGKLRSLLSFMQQYKSRIGIKFSQETLAQDEDILSIPLYAIAEYKRFVKEVKK